MNEIAEGALMDDTNTAASRVDRLMNAVRAETQRRSGQAFSEGPAVGFFPTEPLGAPPSIQVHLPDCTVTQAEATFQLSKDGTYRLKDLLEYHDRAFINAAYWAILGRVPDQSGMTTYLRLLRGGTSKIEILGFLRGSQEGVNAATRIAGLRIPLAVSKLSRWPLIGPVVRVVSAILKLPEIERSQHALEGRMVAAAERDAVSAAERQGAIAKAIRDLESGFHQLAAFAASKPGHEALNHLEASLDFTNDSIAQLRVLVEKKADSVRVRSSLDELSTEIRRSLDGITQSVQLLQSSKAERAELDERTANLRETGALLERALDAKADRHQLTALSNHVVALLEARLSAAALDFNAALEGLAKSKVDLAELETARTEIQSAIAGSLRQIDSEIVGLSERKADRSTLELFAPQSALNELARDTRSYMAEALDRVTQGLSELSRSKADRDVLETKSVALEARSAALEARSGVLETQSASLDARSGALEHQSTAFTSALLAAQADIRGTLATALVEVNSSLESLKKSKVDIAVAEVTQRDTRLLLENAMHDVLQKLAAVGASKADRVALESVQQEAKVAHGELHKVIQSAVASLNTNARDIKRNVVDQERRLGLLLEEARKRLPQPISTKQIEVLLKEEDHVLDAMYASFEDIFRGSREDIKRRQAIYIPYIQTAGAGTATTKIIDLGCGRGEWLENLRDTNLQALGIDTNRIFLERCRDLDLDVVESDAVTYLRGLKQKSVGAVTSFHLIEHLPHKTLIALLDAAFQALRPGGIIILETPNPRNIQVGGCNFYLDPTHRQPLPPELMRYLTEARGFVQVEVKELHPFPPENLVTGGAPAVNDTLNRFFFSAQDYAIIAKKP